MRLPTLLPFALLSLSPQSALAQDDGAAPSSSEPVHVCSLTLGGRPLDTQWFTLPASQFAPFVPPSVIGLPFPGVIPGNVPYTTPGTLPNLVAGDNPSGAPFTSQPTQT